MVPNFSFSPKRLISRSNHPQRAVSLPVVRATDANSTAKNNSSDATSPPTPDEPPPSPYKVVYPPPSPQKRDPTAPSGVFSARNPTQRAPNPRDPTSSPVVVAAAPRRFGRRDYSRSGFDPPYDKYGDLGPRERPQSRLRWPPPDEEPEPSASVSLDGCGPQLSFPPTLVRAATQTSSKLFSLTELADKGERETTDTDGTSVTEFNLTAPGDPGDFDDEESTDRIEEQTLTKKLTLMSLTGFAEARLPVPDGPSQRKRQGLVPF